jgi:hypothetical protein
MFSANSTLNIFKIEAIKVYYYRDITELVYERNITDKAQNFVLVESK